MINKFFNSNLTEIKYLFIQYINNAINPKDIHVAYAAPIAPQTGMRQKHNPIFKIAPKNLVQAAYFGWFFKKTPGVWRW